MKNRMEMIIPAIAQNEAFARMVISAFLVQADPALSVVSEVRTAVSEAVTNAVVHAYPENKPGKISMTATIDENKLEIQIEDFGCGIEDVEQAMRPFYTTKPEHERTGMGFSLMMSFMDGVKVYSSPGSGTIVMMTKLLACIREDAV